MTDADLLWPTPLDGLGLGAGHGAALAVLAALLATCAVIVVVDWRARIIPDVCNLLLAALGLGVAVAGGETLVLSAALQGAASFALFWAARALYRALRSATGLGLGDVKFLGAAGVWVGLGGLPPLLLVASTAALAFVGLQWWRGTAVTGRHAVPFGPFLVLGFLAVLGGALA